MLTSTAYWDNWPIAKPTPFARDTSGAVRAVRDRSVPAGVGEFAKMYGMDDGSAALRDRGLWVAEGGFETCEEAFQTAFGVVSARCAADGIEPPSIIGDFVIPPPDRAVSRDFQTLHFDFGLPLDPKVAQDVARYTALHVPRGAVDVSAITRLVPLVSLLEQRDWPRRSAVLDRFAVYGRTHGAWDDSRGYSEGSLARVIEAAAAGAPLLPSVKSDPDFLCGMEFDSVGAEHVLSAPRLGR
jgi:hypothetical protein